MLQYPSTELFVNALKMVKEASKQLDAQAGIQTPGCSANTMHRQLRQTGVDTAHAGLRAQHRPHGSSTANIVSDLEDLQLTACFLGNTHQQRGAGAIRGGMTIWIRLNSDADVELRAVILEVDVHEVGVEGMGDIGGDEEAVGEGLREERGFAGGVRWEKGADDASDGGGEQGGLCTLAEERADFFVVVERDGFDDAGGFGGGGEKTFDGRVGAETVVDAAGEDEFLGDATEAGGLRVEELELPVEDRGGRNGEGRGDGREEERRLGGSEGGG